MDSLHTCIECRLDAEGENNTGTLLVSIESGYYFLFLEHTIDFRSEGANAVEDMDTGNTFVEEPSSGDILVSWTSSLLATTPLGCLSALLL